jgi:glutamyl endopeptidase
MLFTWRRSSRAFGVLTLFAAGCIATDPQADGPAYELDVELALDGHDVEPPANYVVADYIEIDPEAVLIDPGLFAPPPAPDEVVEKWLSSPDSRKRVADTTASPQKMAALLLITLDGRTSICSGTMVGKDAVLTNAHCLFNPATQLWAKNVVVLPGAYPDPTNPARYKAPFGSSAGRKLFTPTNWRLGTGNVQRGLDYGIVRTKAALASEWRSVGYATAPSGNIEYYGYQGDLARYQMYKARGPIDRWADSTHGLMQVKVSLFQGGSGAGISASSTSSIVGVMRATSSTFNVAVFFNASKRDQIRSWIKL